MNPYEFRTDENDDDVPTYNKRNVFVVNNNLFMVTRISHPMSVPDVPHQNIYN